MNEQSSEQQRRGDRSEEASRWWAGGYITPILVVLFTIFWPLMAYWLIGTRARNWEYGVVPYVPAQSAFTSRPAPSGSVPRQVELPVRSGGPARGM